MNLFYEAKKVLDKDGKVNALGPYGKQKLTGREVSTYFRRNKVKDAQIKKAVEVALDMGGAMSVAYKEITKFYGKKVADSKEVQNALQYANEETFREGLGELEEGQFWGQKKMAKSHAAQLRKSGAVMLQKKEKGGESRITLPKGHKDIKKYMKQGYKQIPIESVEPEKKNLVDEGRSELDKHIKSVKHISDIEIRFSDEKEWKRMSALVKKELRKPEYKSIKPKDVYYSPDPLQIGFGDPDGKSKTNIKPIVDLIANQTKDKETRLKSMYESIRRGEPFVGTKDTTGGKGTWRNLTALRKKKFDALYKKMDGGPEHRAIKKKIKNQVKADDAFHALVMKKVTNEEVTEAYSKNSKSGAEVAKMMMKSKTMKGFAAKVKKMKTVTADQLDKMLPDYVSGGDIGAMFEDMQGRFDGKYSTGSKTKAALYYRIPYNRLHGEPDISAAEALAKKFKLKYEGLPYKMMAEMTIEVEGSPKNLKKFHSALTKPKVIKSVDGKKYLKVKLQKIYDYNITESVDITEGKLGDSIIRKDFPNVWAASAKDRTILKKFHAKVDTKNYKKQKELYNKNKKAFMSGLGKEKLSSIMKKMTVKKGPMKGWMTDDVVKETAKLLGYELEEINMNMPEKVRVQLLTLYNKAMDLPYGSPAFKGVKKEIDKINQKYAIKEDSEAKAELALKQAREKKALKAKHEREMDQQEQVKPFFDTYRDMQIQEKKELDPATIGSIAAMTDNNDHNKALITLAKAMKEMKVVKMLELLSQMHKVEGSMSSDMVAIRKGMYQELMKKSKRVFSNHKEIYKAF